MQELQPPLRSIEFIKSRFNYDPVSGVLSWKRQDNFPGWWNTRYAGTSPKARDSLGYVRAKLTMGEWRGYVSCHRICFLIHNGYVPIVVDHINGVVDDNRACNLRAADFEKNTWNRKQNSGTLTGLKGVKAIRYNEGPSKGEICGYVSLIGHNGKRIYLGYFPTAEMASEAYKAKESELREEFSRK